jgi:hypothetical protein
VGWVGLLPLFLYHLLRPFAVDDDDDDDDDDDEPLVSPPARRRRTYSEFLE